MSSKKMTRTQVYIPIDLYEDAKLYAKSEGKSISNVLRDGLKHAVYDMNRQKKNPLSGLAGSFSVPGGKSNIASKHNEIYDL